MAPSGSRSSKYTVSGESDGWCGPELGSKMREASKRRSGVGI